MPDSEISKDQTIEHLRKTVNSLRGALTTIDRDVDRAAAKYLDPTVPHGHLRFSQFLDLLVLETKRHFNRVSRSRASGKEESNLSVEVRKLMEEKIEERIAALLPEITIKIEEVIRIPVLIGKKKHPAILFRSPEAPPTFHAFPLRGYLKAGKGDSPENAYEELRENILFYLAQTTSREVFLKFLSAKHTELSSRFNAAKPFRLDEIGGFKVDVRIEEASDGK